MRGDSIEFEASQGLFKAQWTTNHLNDTWADIVNFRQGDSTGELLLTDINKKLETIPGVDVLDNHTISLRAIQFVDNVYTASPLMTVEVMVMDNSTIPLGTTSSDGISTNALIGIFIAGIVVFLVALLIISTISNKEEGTLAGKDLRALLDSEVDDVVDADIIENPFLDEGS